MLSGNTGDGEHTGGAVLKVLTGRKDKGEKKDNQSGFQGFKLRKLINMVRH